jgi:glycosyltransferase involved in cell wall biosynthesis
MQSLVSILIPVYNGESSIFAALTSCLEQTYPHIEILVLDDGSTDRTSSIVKSFDNLKVTLIKHDGNRGIAHARNTLLAHARGEYIAWLDADDTMGKDRIDEQVGFMQAHPDVDIAGSWIYTDDPSLPVKKLPLLHTQIKTMLWFKNCMIQPSIISKNFYKTENIWYDTEFNNSVEDYELWYRLSSQKTFANIPKFLTTYHLTTGGPLSAKQDKNLFRQHINTLWKHKWKSYNILGPEKLKQVFQDFLYENKRLTTQEERAILHILYSLKLANPDPFFRLVISFHLLRLWRNMGLAGKIMHMDLLGLCLYYSKMKRNYLF